MFRRIFSLTPNVSSTALRRMVFSSSPSSSISAPFSSISLPFRSFSSPSSSSSSPSSSSSSRSSPPAPVTSTSLSKATEVKELKNELFSSLQADAEDLTQQPNEHLEKFIKDNSFKIVHNDNGSILVNKISTADGYQMTISFDIDPDQDMESAMRDYMGAPGGPSPDAMRGENGEDGEGAESDGEDKMPIHTFDIDLRLTNNTAKSNFLRITCQADAKGELVVDTIAFDSEAPTTFQINKSTDTQTDLASKSTALRIDPGELSDDTQQRLHNYLSALGINDELAQFVQYYAQLVRTQCTLKNVKQLQEFLKH